MDDYMYFLPDPSRGDAVKSYCAYHPNAVEYVRTGSPAAARVAFDPCRNSTALCLMDPASRDVLQNCKHGWIRLGGGGAWVDDPAPAWAGLKVWRAKPAPIVVPGDEAAEREARLGRAAALGWTQRGAD